MNVYVEVFVSEQAVFQGDAVFFCAVKRGSGLGVLICSRGYLRNAKGQEELQDSKNEARYIWGKATLRLWPAIEVGIAQA